MKRIILSSLLATIVLLTSCLKDDEFGGNKYGIGESGVSGIGFKTATRGLALNSQATPQSIYIIVGLNGSQTSSTPINYTVASTPALVTGTFTPLPAANFTFTASGTIPAGQYFDTLEVVLPNATLLDATKTYGVAFTITSTDPGYVVMANANSTLVTFSLKNKYDGIYTVVSGLVTRYTAPGVPAGDALSGQLAGNPDVRLITTGANSVAIPIPASPNPGTIYWAYGNNSQVAGVDGISLTVDPVTNLVTVKSSGNATLANWTGKENKYDPATKTFYLAFRWNPTANVREYEIVLKYKGPRP